MGLVVAASLLAGCGGSEGGASTLTWYINPDTGGQAEIAKRCTKAAEGEYRIETAQLPRDAAGHASSWCAGWPPTTPPST
jgi:multiple sugar transport system substrate-binding protein